MRLAQLQHLMHNEVMEQLLAEARTLRQRFNEQILNNMKGFAEEREQAIGEIRGLRFLENKITSEILTLTEELENERPNGQPQ